MSRAMIEDTSNNNNNNNNTNKSPRYFSLIKLEMKEDKQCLRKKTYPNAVVKKLGQQILKFKIL